MSRSPKKRNPPPSDGPFLRLLAAGVLFLLCLGLKARFPAQAELYQQQISSILSSSTDFHAAFSRLGERLNDGEDVVGAVGDWCVAVFAPEPVTLEGEDAPSRP